MWNSSGKPTSPDWQGRSYTGQPAGYRTSSAAPGFRGTRWFYDPGAAEVLRPTGLLSFAAPPTNTMQVRTIHALFSVLEYLSAVVGRSDTPKQKHNPIRTVFTKLLPFFRGLGYGWPQRGHPYPKNRSSPLPACGASAGRGRGMALWMGLSQSARLCESPDPHPLRQLTIL